MCQVKQAEARGRNGGREEKGKEGEEEELELRGGQQQRRVKRVEGMSRSFLMCGVGSRSE